MIYFMRHGQDDEAFIGGWSEGRLIQRGKEEVEKSAVWLKENKQIERIYASDIKRARETTEIVEKIIPVPVTYTKILREQNKGLLNGMDRNLAKKLYPTFLEKTLVDTVYPEGESLRDLYNRMKSTLKTLEHLEENTLLITHRGVINMMYYLLREQDLDNNKEQFNVTPASIHEVDIKNKIIRKVR